MSKAPGAAAVASWDALPAIALEAVFSHLAGDLPSLCAAACVARAWRDTAKEPRLWMRPRRLPRAAAARLTDAHLKTLVARATGRLRRLDLRGARLLTNAGLLAALQQPHAIVTFIADYRCEFSAEGVAAALHARSGRLRALSLRGVRCLPDDGEVWSDGDDGDRVLGELDELLERGVKKREILLCEECGRLCREEDRCEGCETTLCLRCQGRPRWRACEDCGEVYCPDCADGHSVY